ncbi:hypothetical protein Ancab_016227 [Ancistrocladus abbreviatus]
MVPQYRVPTGHGGSRAAEYLKQHLFENLMKHPKFLTDTKFAITEFKIFLSTNSLLLLAEPDALMLCGSPLTLYEQRRETYKQTDKDFLDAEKDTFRDDGSTASTAVLVGNHLYVANVGHSRIVISKAGKAIPLSEDHKPNRSDEQKKIESSGGVVMWAVAFCRHLAVGGVLAMSRAFGNRMLKQFVVAEPEIQSLSYNCYLVETLSLYIVLKPSDTWSDLVYEAM